ncbi:unnamed protein product [Prunus armeniaca]|uniref:Leucine-rich repeat-containing N-terminal plant-type domain-containing protein n=1 Tax=Prunus armeniaca TaxID=36596 RepID=A0A6J5VU30_PRUAR|nr:unnamed protein product [Prunus armeniaca]
MAFLMPVLLSKRNLDMFVSSVLWLLLLSCSFSFGVESDINCLKSIKASLEDTLGYLNSSWDFNNNTEGFICNFLGIECWHPHESKVLNIKLSELGLKGQFPRGVENCTSLTGLDLSGNMLSGPLPHDIDKILTWVTSLDLSSNSFSGLIPATLSNCSYMNVLKLDNNQFSGNIPAEVYQLTRLRTFSVANNLLSGQVPPFGENIASIRRDSYANNPGLCGYPLKPCPSISQKTSLSLNVVRVFKSNGVLMVAAADELQQPRCLANCTCVTHLSSNHLQGPLPADICHTILYITNLDFSNNTFSGQIRDLPNCAWLNLLKLDDNAFYLGCFLGLRNSVWPTIFCLGQSHSSFMGAQSYVINFGFCGGPLELCKSSSSLRMMLLLLNLVLNVDITILLFHSIEKLSYITYRDWVG